MNNNIAYVVLDEFPNYKIYQNGDIFNLKTNTKISVGDDNCCHLTDKNNKKKHISINTLLLRAYNIKFHKSNNKDFKYYVVDGIPFINKSAYLSYKNKNKQLKDLWKESLTFEIIT